MLNTNPVFVFLAWWALSDQQMITEVRKIEKLTRYISRSTGPIALILGHIVELIDLNNFGVDHICATSN